MLLHYFLPTWRWTRELFLFSTLIDKSPQTSNISQPLKRKKKSGLPYPHNRTFWFLVNMYVCIYNFCVEVFEKTISHTKMIDHSLERYYNGVCYRLYKILCAGTAARGARLKLNNCVLTMMLSTNRYKKHSRVFSRSFFNFCRSFKALQYPNQKILTK